MNSNLPKSPWQRLFLLDLSKKWLASSTGKFAHGVKYIASRKVTPPAPNADTPVVGMSSSIPLPDVRASGDAMSEKAAEKKPAEAPAKDAHGKEAPADGKKKGGGLMAKTPVILGGVMLLEAVVLIGGFKFIGGAPRSAAAVEIATDSTGKDADGKPTGPVDNTAPVELQLVDFRAPNKQSGRTFIYDVSIFITTKAATGDKVKDLISSRDALIKDRIRTIIAEMDPDKLGGGSEPGLETLRRQVKYQLDQIIGDGLIDEVLVPKCIAFRTDY
jgi:flagellar basal body-associated protein FliL